LSIPFAVVDPIRELAGSDATAFRGFDQPPFGNEDHLRESQWKRSRGQHQRPRPGESRHGPRTGSTVTAPCRVGVVVITKDRAPLLARTLRHMTRLPERPPIVVVDNASVVGSVRRIARSFSGVRLVELESNIGAAARTVGAEKLSTPYVAFADDDSWWSPGALHRAADLFDKDPTIGLIAARILVGAEQREDPTNAVMRRSPLPSRSGRPEPRVLGFLACGAIVRRDAFLDIGGFHPRFGVGAEEALLAIDLAASGYDLVYSDDIIAHHFPAVRTYDGRDRTALRNALWTTWLRYPVADLPRRTARLLGRARREPRLLRGVIEAMAGIGWVVRERRVLPADVAEVARLLD
jgi:GT2 family glycosyltransferase